MTGGNQEATHMTTSELRELLTVLKEFGVTAYAFKDISIELKPRETEAVQHDELEEVEPAFPPPIKADGLTEEEQVLLYGKVMP